MPSIFEIYTDLSPRSALPPGGSPADDREYLDWRRRFEAEFNARWLDRMTRFGAELPGREPLIPGRLDEFIFARMGGSRMFEGWNDSHRLRFLGILFRDHRRQVIKLANVYARRNAQLCEVA